nr:MAG TPA: hypothetical protein [Bacteriophage sp.]
MLPVVRSRCYVWCKSTPIYLSSKLSRIADKQAF